MENRVLNMEETVHSLLLQEETMKDLYQLCNLNIASPSLDTNQPLMGNMQIGEWYMDCSVNTQDATLYLAGNPIANINLYPEETKIYVDCQYALANDAICETIAAATGREVENVLINTFQSMLSRVGQEDVCLYKRMYQNGKTSICEGNLQDTQILEESFSREVFILFSVYADEGILLSFADGYDDIYIRLVTEDLKIAEFYQSEMVLDMPFEMDDLYTWLAEWEVDFSIAPTFMEYDNTFSIPYVLNLDDGEKSIKTQTDIPIKEIFAENVNDGIYICKERIVKMEDGDFAFIKSHWGEIKNPYGKMERGYVADAEVLDQERAFKQIQELIAIANPMVVLESGEAMPGQEFIERTASAAEANHEMQEYQNDPITKIVYDMLQKQKAGETFIQEPLDNEVSAVLSVGEKVNRICLATSINGKNAILVMMKYQSNENGIQPEPIVYRSSEAKYTRHAAKSFVAAVNCFNRDYYQSAPQKFEIRKSVSRTENERQ